MRISVNETVTKTLKDNDCECVYEITANEVTVGGVRTVTTRSNSLVHCFVM